MRRLLVFLVVLALAVAAPGLGPARPFAAPSSGACGIEGVPRVVAIGDVHGAYDAFVRILRAAGVIDGRERWAGGATYLVQTGDVLDRGAHSRRVMDLLRRLEREAPRRKGRVLALIGNHETMRLGGAAAGHPPGQGFNRDISAGEVEAFTTARSAELRDAVRANWLARQREEARASGSTIDEAALTAAFDQNTPLGFIEMVQALGEKGDYGKWIRGHVAAAQINGVLFLHGGVSPRIAPLGCEGINAAVAEALTTGFASFLQAPLDSILGVEDGPLWYRGLALEDEAAFAPEVDKILAAAGARAIVVGHTVTDSGRITPRFDGKVVQIDTGMLSEVYKNGRASALEIAGGKWTAIYENGKETLR